MVQQSDGDVDVWGIPGAMWTGHVQLAGIEVSVRGFGTEVG